MFTRQTVKPIWEVWDIFGAANGTTDIPALLQRLAPLSGSGATKPTIDSWIGCLAVNEPVFFPPDEWVPVPENWQRQIVSGKTYDLAVGEGKLLYERCMAKAIALAAANGVAPEDVSARYGPAHLIKPRLGQASFRIAVLDAYRQRCAVTGERSLPVLEAAHIRPYASGGEHSVTNGMPMRRDIHRLFDLGFVSVRPDYTFAVSGALKAQYENGKIYYELEGRSLREPVAPGDRADAHSLEWHYDSVFRG